jgi:hypothetical protein
MDKVAAEQIDVDAHVYRHEPINEKTFSNFLLKAHTSFKNIAVAHIAAISAADVVVVLGGGRKTETASWAAMALNKPFLPLMQFGGTAKELWDNWQYGNELESTNRNLIANKDANNDDLAIQTLVACIRLLEVAKRQAFSATETTLYVGVSLALGLIGFFLATNGAIDWIRAVIVTFTSVLTGWLLSLLIARDRQELFPTLPHAVCVGFAILGIVAFGEKMLGDVIDPGKVPAKSSQLLIMLFGTGLVSGFSVRTSLPVLFKKLSDRANGGG